MKELIENALLKNYEKYYRLAYSYVENEADALDIVQESAYKAMKRCENVKEEAYIETWLYRIVMNTSCDLLRRKKRMSECTYDEQAEPPAAGSDIGASLDVHNALQKLDEKERTIVVLRYFEDMKLEQVAAITGENVNTTKSRLYRALRKLRAVMEGEGVYE
ncbi:MAG: sigma-70 family RNA polymerase sigma factor [Lachnospiraceae bacterium]|nr:sigma-70 family RNA polymerase sigma factor [Lachnospiraceae bacterium]